MRITEQQLLSLQEKAIATLAERWRPLLREHFGARLALLDDAVLVADTVLGIKRGQAHELTQDADLYRFVIARVALGEAFDVDPELPWAARLLAGRSRPASARMKELVARAIERLTRNPPKASAEAPEETLTS